jgi:hypothetical protein
MAENAEQILDAAADETALTEDEGLRSIGGRTTKI